MPRELPSAGKHDSTSNPDSSERDRRLSSSCSGYDHSRESTESVQSGSFNADSSTDIVPPSPAARMT